MKIAFIDDNCHKITDSTSFLVEVLQKEFKVKRFWGNGFKRFDDNEIDEINIYSPDILLFFQRIPNFLILNKFNCKNIIFVPMYDQEIYYSKLEKLLLKTSLFLSKRKFNIKILCFSEAVSKYYKGYNCLNVKYYPKPNKKRNLKPKVYLWHRKDGVTLKQANKLSVGYLLKVKYKDLWLNKKDLELFSKDCGIAIASRYSEGIGMGFLELMAKGVCVVAFDLPTHNEYIINGFNGILFNNRLEVDLSNWNRIGKMAYLSCVKGYASWELDKKEIVGFIKRKD